MTTELNCRPTRNPRYSGRAGPMSDAPWGHPLSPELRRGCLGKFLQCKTPFLFLQSDELVPHVPGISPAEAPGARRIVWVFPQTQGGVQIPEPSPKRECNGFSEHSLWAATFTRGQGLVAVRLGY
ncbi:hypothetical protein CHS0354_005523 [Potamilus streckersoni]|uniref:Uncharacterized protein n=1 Tax=Potamilus streckersoni TaxID=2493646 RepID=A0AAE0W5M9_9BIVA|nr:hypothetical protein CHS0354_005523 [Potamilus streckersoni]